MTETFHDFIRRVQLFADFSEEEASALLRLTNRVRFTAGGTICTEGSPGKFMYIIREGVLRVERQSDTGKPFTIARLGEGQVVGEMSLVDDAPRSASLVAETDGVLYEIRREDFETMKKEMNPAAYKLLRAIAKGECERLRRVNQQVEHYLQNPMALFDVRIETGTMKRSATPDLAERFLSFFGRRKAETR
ncbi:MAG: cyclic nucleotide-binding domain-containing protein [Myxococcales bacterium]|nr:MAG: cyclic nucleotide-binding domain-containing protein [Myxococcales bacterium]